MLPELLITEKEIEADLKKKKFNGGPSYPQVKPAPFSPTPL